MAVNSLDIESIIGRADSIAEIIAQQWSTWDAARSEWKKQMQELDQYWSAVDTKTTSNDKNGFGHNTHRPKITALGENLKSNYKSGLFPNKNWLTFEGDDSNSQSEARRRRVLAYINTKHRKSGFEKINDELLDDYILAGNVFATVYYENKIHVDDKGKRIGGYSGPKIMRIDPFDIVFNPLATSFEDAPKIIRSVKTLGELKRDIEERPELNYEEDVFNLINKSRVQLKSFNTEDVDKYVQLNYDGFGTYTQYMGSGNVELLEFYGDLYDISTGEFYKNHVITVVDRRHVLRMQPLDTWSGRPHIYHCAWRKRRKNLWGQGPLDNVVGLQYRIDHLENAKADAFDAMLAPDVVKVGNVEERRLPNGAIEYTVTDGQGSVSYLRPDTTVLNANFEINDLEDKMEEYVGNPKTTAGFKVPGEQTKFEFSQLNNAAGRTFQTKMTQYETDLLEKLVNAELELAVKNFSTNSVDSAKEENEYGGVTFLNITKEDVLVNGKLVPIGARHFALLQQLAQDLMMFTNGPLNDEEIRQHFPSEKLALEWEKVLGYEPNTLVQKYGRIAERLKAQSLMSVANKRVMEEEATPTEEPEDDFDQS